MSSGCYLMPQEITPVSHVIFDFDGTLIDTIEVLIAASKNVAKRSDKELPPQFEALIPNVTSFEEIAQRVLEFTGLEADIKEYGEQINEEHLRLADRFKLMPGAEKLVRHLHAQHIPIAIATACKSDRYFHIAKHFDNFFNIGHYFDHAVFGGDDKEVKNNKPQPDVYLVCADRFHPPPTDVKKVLIFEDSLTGIKAGVASGMQTVWVPDKRIPIDKSINCSLILKSLEDFEPQLFGLPPY